METELWQDIPGLPRYQASNLGHIRSWCRIGRGQNGLANSPHIVRLTIGKNPPYAFATVHFDGKQRGVLVHRLVLAAFNGPCPEGMQGCHNDGNRLNNCLDNLRWDTICANHADKKHHGTYLDGERCPVAKLTSDQVVSIRTIRASGAELKQVAAQFGTTFQQVYAICTGRTWRSAGGPIEPPRIKRTRHQSPTP